MPNESAGKKQYMLRSISDPNYAVGFVDRTEADCLDLQGKFIFVRVPILSRPNLDRAGQPKSELLIIPIHDMETELSTEGP